MTRASSRKRSSIIVLGTGGHARVVVSVIQALKKFSLAGCLELGRVTAGEKILGVPVIGDLTRLKALHKKGVRLAAVAVGDNEERRAFFLQCRAEGFLLPALIHPSALVEPSARVGEGALICLGAILAAAVEVGEGAIVNTGSRLDHETVVGNFSQVAPGCSVAGRVRIGEGAFLGIGSSVKEKTLIGAWSLVGAGSVVVKNIAAGVTAYGVPARPREKK